jgi:uncharacterized membrane protein YphA (DoxX/SURF4 family)
MPRPLQIFLALLRIALGASILGPGIHKISWLMRPALEPQLASWLSHGPNPLVAKYLHLVIPHHAVLARVVAVGELTVGTLLILGLFTPLAAVLGFLMIANFHFASGAMLSMDYLTGQDGLVFLLVFPVLLFGKAGLALGLDGLLGKRVSGGGGNRG